MSRRMVALFLMTIGAVIAGVWYLRSSWTTPATEPSAGATATSPESTLSKSESAAGVRTRSPAAPVNAGEGAPPLPSGIGPAPLSPLTASFESSGNLAQLVRDLAARAAAGDPQAARAVARALDECAHLSATPDLGERLYKSSEGMPADRREAALAHLSRYRERCAELARTEKITPQRLRDAEQAASHGNDLVDQGRRLVESSSTMDATEVKNTLRRIVESRDAEAIAGMSDAMGERHDGSEPFGPRSGSDVHVMAWKLVACDLGMPCGPTSALVRQACMVHGRCIRGDFRALVRFYHLTPWEYELAAREEREILQEIANGDFNRIFP